MVDDTSQPRLEVWEPSAAIERAEAYLAAEGFFGSQPAPRPERSADVFLGYRISDALRRGGRPALPEPIELPAAVATIRDDDRGTPDGPAGPYHVGRWERTWSSADYARAVADARAAIAAGEIYQVNLVQHLSAAFDGDPAGVAAALAPLQPRHPWPMEGDGWTIISASPELFLARRGDRVWTMPIKGTRRSGEGAALLGSTKDAAEHVMIVDLERNDLGRICDPGSIAWPELMQARSMTGVEHLVSLVEGRVSADVTWAGAIGALFPGGSVTGAPKIAAMDHINALEPVGRGAAMGALGRVWPNGDFDLSLTIRTFAIGADRIHLWVGGGIVWDSDPAAEVEESWIKARPLLDAIGAGSRRTVAA